MAALAAPARGGQDLQDPERLQLAVVADLDKNDSGSSGSDSVRETDREDQPALDLVAEGGTQSVWEDR